MTRKRKFIVVKRTVRDLNIVDSMGRQHKFWNQVGGVNDSYYINEPAIAQEIDARYGKGGTHEVFVKEYDRAGWFANTREPGGIHSYFWGWSKQFEEGWERIFGSKSGKKRKDAGALPEV